MFAWLRRKVRDAVLGGVNDALATIQRGPADDGPLRLEYHDAPDDAEEPEPSTAGKRTAAKR